jgi:dihydroflavonol-4-reductase
MTVLVTGAAGHVGVTLVRLLASRGYKVRTLIHKHPLPPDGENILPVRGDVCDIDSLYPAFDGIDTVFHLAGRISIGGEKYEALEKINVSGTRNVVAACLKTGVRRLVHFSSIHALVQEPWSTPVDELRPLVSGKNHPCYDRSKAAGELEIRQGMARGINAVIVSPTAILGPNDYLSSFFGKAFLGMANGRLPALVSGGFDWVDVRDVAEGALLAADKAPPGAKYMLSGHFATVQELAQMISEFTGAGCPRFVCPMWLASGAAPFAEAYAGLAKKAPIFTRDSMRALRGCNRRISHEKASRDLGYTSRPLRETIKDTLEWYAANGKLAGPLKGTK